METRKEGWVKLGAKWFWDAVAAAGGGGEDYDNQENQKRLLELSRTRNAVWMKSFLQCIDKECFISIRDIPEFR